MLGAGQVRIRPLLCHLHTTEAHANLPIILQLKRLHDLALFRALLAVAFLLARVPPAHIRLQVLVQAFVRLRLRPSPAANKVAVLVGDAPIAALRRGKPQVCISPAAWMKRMRALLCKTINTTAAAAAGSEHVDTHERAQIDGLANRVA